MADVLISPNSTEAKLAAYLRDVAARLVVYGEHDCCVWLGGWLARWLGIDDPSAPFRGRYSDEASAEAMLGATPYPILVGRLARRAGLRSTLTPGVGAVAMVVTPQGVAGAIRTAGGWVLLRQPRGIVRVPPGSLRVIAAWEPGQCPPR